MSTEPTWVTQWLQKFLATARYYDAPALIARLCPTEVDETPPKAIASTCSKRRAIAAL